ncbi:hypothetical protein D3C74_152080 [compost metagenome]
MDSEPFVSIGLTNLAKPVAGALPFSLSVLKTTSIIGAALVVVMFVNFFTPSSRVLSALHKYMYTQALLPVFSTLNVYVPTGTVI